jgi:hypothetical protein
MLFSTQVPSFWNDAQLRHLLRSENVEVNAQNRNPGASQVATILLGEFAPIDVTTQFRLASGAERPDIRVTLGDGGEDSAPPTSRTSLRLTSRPRSTTVIRQPARPQ